mmetsp:Transcript_11392/g.27159  ORF Transcript_11392/g.27159 Transcript_11392/m.27159 type:complete len:700 (-) Transcript_11392:1636-3735(-)
MVLTMMRMMEILVLLVVLVLAFTTNASSSSSSSRDEQRQRQRQYRRRQQQPEDEIFFEGCDTSQYYSETNITDRTELHRLVQTTHRNVLPYTSSSGRDDVWKALQDLDRGFVDNDDDPESAADVDGTVRLIYAQRNDDAVPPTDPPSQQDGGTTATNTNNARTWNREHLFPKSLGVGTSGPDYTDVHHLRPADVNVNSARGNKYFGPCGLFHSLEECRVPAHVEAPLAETDRSIWTPPMSVRGDIARSIMYMELRYDGDDFNYQDEIDLILTDCPELEQQQQQQQQQQSSSSSSSTQQVVGIMAYKSILLQWHIDDPPDERELNRNERVCQRWQGNRNPFVDFRDIATILYGPPKQPLIQSAQATAGGSTDTVLLDPFNCSSSSSSSSSNSGSDISPSSPPDCTATSPTSSTGDTCPPTNDSNAATTEDEREVLRPGDIMIVGVYSDEPDMVALVTLVDLPPGLQLHMTDNAWTGAGTGTSTGTSGSGGGLRSNEGIVRFTVPDPGIGAGTVFGFGPDLKYGSEWDQVQDSFALSAKGDTVLIYYYGDGGGDNDIDEQQLTSKNVPRFVSALSFSGQWLESGLDESSYGTQSSALPSVLLSEGEGTAVITLNHQDNYIYSGPTTGTRDQLQRNIQNSVNWMGSNTRQIDKPPDDFSIELSIISISSSATTTSSSSLCSFVRNYRRFVMYAWLVSKIVII